MSATGEVLRLVNAERAELRAPLLGPGVLLLDDGTEVRTLLTADRLYDVSLMTYPAYEGTDAGTPTC